MPSASRSAARPVGIAALVAVLLLAGCSRDGREPDAKRAATTTTFEPYLLCDLIDLALVDMRKDHVSFVDLLDSPSGTDDDAARGIIALAIMARGRQNAGAFRPTLVFLAERSVAEISEGTGKAPRLTPAIRSNARKLDRFIADGGCG